MSLTKFDLKAISLATKEADKSTCRQKHGAVIYKKNKIISKGYNKYKTHPRAPSYRFPSIHAEVDALLKINNLNISGASLAVVRINKKNHLMNSKPCKKCMNEINKAEIKYVIYSTKEYITKKLIRGD